MQLRESVRRLENPAMEMSKSQGEANTDEENKHMDTKGAGVGSWED